jgi:hypothetical protein
VEKSKTSPGFIKYEVTIEEKDGTIHKEPAYGKDMQDALSRLINSERTYNVEKRVMKNPSIFFIAWVCIMGWPALMTDASSNPMYLAYSFGGMILMFFAAAWWYNYIERK